MALRKIAQPQETQKSDPAAVSQIPGDYYLTREQLAAIRHLLFAMQGVGKELSEQEDCLGICDLFQGFSSALSSVYEELQDQRIEKGGAA